MVRKTIIHYCALIEYNEISLTLLKYDNSSRITRLNLILKNLRNKYNIQKYTSTI